MDRTGIGDAELARRIPVSRPTLVRWKEGVTTRPRYREDVVRCAELLRLTDAEQDEFLLAAGFSPETATVPESSSDEIPEQADDDAATTLFESEMDVVDEPGAESVPADKPKTHTRRAQTIWIAVAAAALVLAIAAAFAIRLLDDPSIPVAAEGESLIVMAPFVNYTAGQQGFNVLGRLKEEVDREIAAAGVTGVRTAEWPVEIENDTDAEEAGLRSDATIVIWGEYDSGRVLAKFTTPRAQSAARDLRVVDIASSPSELPTTINAGLTDEVRHVALLTLGQLYLEQDEFDRAKTVLIRAIDRSLPDPVALANLRYLLGRAYLGGKLADYDEAIWLFTQVLAAQPRSVEAYDSRAIAYLDRGRPGDADLAVADLTHSMSIRPDRASTHLNRAVAHMELGGRENLDRAVADLTRAIRIQPDYAVAHVNRAVAYMERGGTGDLDLAFEDLEQALELQPELAAAYLGRGNAYLARRSPGDLELALDDFSRAVALEPNSPTAYFNRGLAYSEMEELDLSLSDFHRSQELDPRKPEFNRTLCWQLTVVGEPEQALPFCELAIDLEPSGTALDGRGFAYAVMGRNADAVADLRAFLSWLDTSPKDSCRDHYRPSRQAWVEDLEAGRSPFDVETLRDLRVRPGLMRDAPC